MPHLQYGRHWTGGSGPRLLRALGRGDAATLLPRTALASTLAAMAGLAPPGVCCSRVMLLPQCAY